MEGKIKELTGILKSSAAAQRAADPREIAIQHARVIQHRKDLEAQILDSLILLSEYPLVRGRHLSAARPAATDAADFARHVRLFQPSDYDDLIEERNVNGLCGYTLCPRPHVQTGGGGEWTLSRAGEIVRRKDLERWCSAACARRALYVKVQLNETAAWERAGIPDIGIDLLDEKENPDATETDEATRQMANLKMQEEQRAERDAELAMERGDRLPAKGGLTTGKQKVTVTLKERETTTMPDIKNLAIGEEDDHLLVEGHRARITRDEPMQ